MFPILHSLCYYTIVLRDRANMQGKKALKMLKEYYESSSHREGK